jgi:hypothetical protein
MNTKTITQPPVSSRPDGTFNRGALKLKAACEYLGCISPSSLRRLIKRGLLKPNRTLRHLVFSIAELDRFLLEGQR